MVSIGIIEKDRNTGFNLHQISLHISRAEMRLFPETIELLYTYFLEETKNFGQYCSKELHKSWKVVSIKGNGVAASCKESQRKKLFCPCNCMRQPMPGVKKNHKHFFKPVSRWSQRVANKLDHFSCDSMQLFCDSLRLYYWSWAYWGIKTLSLKHPSDEKSPVVTGNFLITPFLSLIYVIHHWSQLPPAEIKCFPFSADCLSC